MVSQRSSNKESSLKSHRAQGTEHCTRKEPALVRDPETLGDAIRKEKQLGLDESIMHMMELLCANMDEALPRFFSAGALDSLAAVLNNACDRYETNGRHCTYHPVRVFAIGKYLQEVAGMISPINKSVLCDSGVSKPSLDAGQMLPGLGTFRCYAWCHGSCQRAHLPWQRLFSAKDVYGIWSLFFCRTAAGMLTLWRPKCSYAGEHFFNNIDLARVGELLWQLISL